MRGETLRTILRWLISAFYLAAGIVHLRSPEAFLPIVPDWVPLPRAAVIATGLWEIAGAAAFFVPGLRRAAGIAMAVYAVCVYPANIKHAFESIRVAGLSTSWLYHAPRLALQPVIVWWALFAGGLVDWPFRRRV